MTNIFQSGISVTGQFLQLTEKTDSKTGDVTSHINLLVTGDAPEVIKIKTQRPKFWKSAKKENVTVNVKLFSPADRPSIYYSEVFNSSSMLDDENPFDVKK